MNVHAGNGRRPTHSGFTLIEVVVALAVLALSLGALYESFGWSLRRAAAVEQRERAWLTAQSLLAGIRSEHALRAGAEQGEAPGGLKWESRIVLRDGMPAGQGRLAAFEVTIDVSWGSGSARRIRLQSIETSRVAS